MNEMSKSKQISAFVVLFCLIGALSIMALTIIFNRF